MAKFSYRAKDNRNKPVTGTIEARSRGEAKSKLKRKKLKSVGIKAYVPPPTPGEAPEKILGIFTRNGKGQIDIAIGGGKPPKTKDLIVFTKQFATMLDSNVPMIQALKMLAVQQKNDLFARALRGIAFKVENGETLSGAMSNYKKIFDTLYISMIEAGEMSGSLDDILRNLVVYIEKAAKIKKQVKSAMMYPAFVGGAAAGTVTFLMVFVVPGFSAMFESNGQELPGITQFVINVSNFMQDNVVTGMIVGAVLTVVGIAYRKSEKGLKVTDGWMLNLPVVGSLLRKIAVGRFCQTLSTMLGAGVAVLEALSICARSAGNKVVEDFILNVRLRVSEGSTFAEPLGEGKLFPDMVVSMVEVGEKTGKLDEMLSKVAKFYEEEVDDAVKAMISMIEPILIIGLGGVVGTIVIAMFLPMFDMGKNIT